MLIDRPQIVEGSVILNATVPSGTAAPSNPAVGELFFFTTAAATGSIGLHTYAGSVWNVVATGGELDSHVADNTLHVTPAQNTLLDGLAGTLTSTELNYVDGVTSPIQTQLNSKLNLSGGTMTGALAMGANKITDLGTPTVATDATNLQYVEAEISRSVPLGLEGQVPFIATEGTRTSEQDFIVHVGQFVESDTELTAAQTRIVSGATIFNEWYRFSHYNSTGVTATRTSNVATITMGVASFDTSLIVGQPVTLTGFADSSLNGTFTILSRPTTSTYTIASTGANIAVAVSGTQVFDSYQPALVGELTGWSYDQGTDTISSTINSNSHIGFVSDKKYSSYEHEVQLSSTNVDDDTIGVVLAWHIDQAGREHTLTAIRSCGGNGFTWRVVYNFQRSDTITVSDKTDQIKWGNGNYGATAAAAGYSGNPTIGGWDDFPLGTRVRVVRDGDTITVDTTDLGSTTYVPSAQIVINLASGTQTYLNQFRGPKAYGYSSLSQASAAFKVLKFSDNANKIYDVRNGNVYKYVSGAWTLDGTTTLLEDIGPGRYLFDRYTLKTYFIDPDLGVTKTARNLESEVTALQSFQTTAQAHINDETLHITAAQDTLLDGITVGAVDINRLVTIDTTLTSLGFASVASALSSLQNNKLNLSGGTMTGNLTMSSGAKVTGLPTPSADSDAANKAYVDSLAGGIDWKEAVKAATTSAVTLSGLQTIDGVALVANDRVLVKDQGTPAENGIYLVSSGAWSRAADYNSALEVSQSAVYVLAGGTANGRGSFVQPSTVASFPGTAITFTPFSGPVINSAGNGISLGVGGLVSVKESYGITFDGGGNVAVDLYTGGGLMTTTDGTASSTAAGAQLSLTKVGTAGTYKSVTTDAYGRITAGTNPTTLAGYGITDAQPLDAELTALAGLATTGLYTRTAAGTVVTRSIAVSGTGLSITNGNGVSGNPTVTSNATSANTASTIVARDASGNFSAGAITATSVGATTFTGALSGNATTATTLQTARTINGVSFNGSANITIDASTTNAITFNNGGAGVASGTTFDGSVARTISYNTIGAPSTTGTNASGTWGISITGNSATTSQTLFGRVDTNSVNRGSYGSISITGTTGGYAGIDFAGALATFMIRATDQLSGLYKEGAGGWVWQFDGSGNLAVGTVPGGSVTGTVSSASSATLATKASTLAQNGGNGSAMTFNWSGQSGQPTWLWGSNDGVNHYVWNPSNFSVAFASNAGNANSISNAVGSTFTWTGIQYFTANMNTGTGTNPPLQAHASTGSGAGAIMAFHRAGQYAVNMGLDSDNVFRIGGWSASANRLQLDMSGNLTVAGDITAFSDIRKKKDIEIIDNAMARVEQLRGVTFTRVEDDVRGTGVIAQDVQAVLPEAIKIDNEGTLSVAYGNMVGLLIEAVKDLNTEIKNLKAEIAALKGQA